MANTAHGDHRLGGRAGMSVYPVYPASPGPCSVGPQLGVVC